METFFSLVSGLIIGMVLGLLGGGGALMAIPVLIYGLGYSFRVAIGSSLALVSVGALPALILYNIQGSIIWRAVLLMGLGGVVGAFAGSQLSGLFAREWLLTLLVGLMALSAWNMLKPVSPKLAASLLAAESARAAALNWQFILAGIGVGLLTGLVGVGGGFLLVPVLMGFGRLFSREAIASSLVIILLNSFSGAIGYWALLPFQNSSFLWLMIGSVFGSGLGFWLSLQLSNAMLKRGFGLLLIVLIALLLIFPPSH